jgi:putative membrane protein insertion efficiency factor
VKPLLIFMVRAYQATLGPLLGGACRFHPSCSAYAVEAVERHGAARGGWLAAWRLAKCHPFGASGYDPVPEEMAVAPSGCSKQRPCEAPQERAQ